MADTVASGVPTEVIDTIPKFAPGETQQYRGNTYRYVRCGTEDSVAAAVGAMVYYTSSACDTITTDESDGVSTEVGAAVAGVWALPAEAAAGTCFDNQHWCWIQVTGVPSVVAAETVRAGDSVYASAVDGTVAPLRGTTDVLLGALVDDPDVTADLADDYEPCADHVPYCCGVAVTDCEDGYAAIRLAGLI